MPNIEKEIQTIHEEVRRYMPSLLPRLALNYGVPIGLAMLFNYGLTAYLINFVPRSTANAFAFTGNVIILVGLWRWLESRNQATGLLLLYTAYSSQRRALQQKIQTEADKQTLENEFANLQSSAETFLNTAQARGLPARPD